MLADARIGWTPSIKRTTISDALVRIPSAHFRNMSWAQDAIARCTELISSAINGDSTRTAAWLRDVGGGPDGAAMVSVLSAVCDAIVATAVREENDAARFTNFVSSFEREISAQYAAEHAQKDLDTVNDSDIAELAAGLVRVVRMHDKDTAVHLDATGALAGRIAGELDLASEQVLTIELAARLHDIGKVGVRKDVLCKPGSLSADEWQEMRMHAEIGAAVLHDTPKLAHLAPIVRAHHERVDGYGYPDRLRASEIPLEARVIAVADAFHAMTTERSYRRAMLPNEALEVLAENAGAQFDSDVVEATFQLFRYVRRARRAIA